MRTPCRHVHTQPGTVILAAGVLLLATFLPALAATAAHAGGETSRVSVAADGTQANAPLEYGTTELISATPEGPSGTNMSGGPARMSADGRLVVFVSNAEDLVDDDANETTDVFVRDRQAGTTELVSVTSDGTQGNGGSGLPAISRDGRWVTFLSLATNLVAGDTNGRPDVFVHDRQTGTTERVSVSSAGLQADGSSSFSAISDDGRFVAFESGATNLVPGDTNGDIDIFVRDRQEQTTTRVSVSSDGKQGEGPLGIGRSGGPSISGDGRLVAFHSHASNLVEGDTNQRADVFVHDRQQSTTTRVSVLPDGTQGNIASVLPQISGEGGHVAFSSFATNFLDGPDTNREDHSDVFVADLDTRDIERVSVSSGGNGGDGYSEVYGISDDGRFVSFQSAATNLVADDTNGVEDAFLRDRSAGTTRRVSLGPDGAEVTARSTFPIVSGTGNVVSFMGYGDQHVAEDANGQPDSFVHVLSPIVELDIQQTSDQVLVSGRLATTQAVVSRALDAPDDGAPGATATGGELTRASLTHRPAQGDLLIRVGLAASADGPTAAGLIHGYSVVVDGARYEVRATATDPTASPPASASYTLLRCDPDCVAVAPLTGSYAGELAPTTGPEVQVAVPLEAIGAADGTAVADMSAFSARGTPVTGSLAEVDRVALPDGQIASWRVDAGVAAAGVAAADVVYSVPVELAVDASFSTSVPTGGLEAGAYNLWVRACLRTDCFAAYLPIMLDS